MSFRNSLGLLAATAVITVAGCDRPPTAANVAGPGASALSSDAAERGAMDRLARRVAKALIDPGFRAYVKDQLDRSPFPEHKVQFQNFLRASNGRALKDMA